MTTMAITVGEGVKSAQGRLVQISPPPVEGVISVLREQPQKLERWWSVHNWARAYRTTKGWESSIGVAVDLDYKFDGQSPTTEAIASITALVQAGKMPGSLFHLTPHGARVVFVYEIACTHREMQIAASKGAASLVEQALAAVDLFDYVVDPCSWDLARLYFTPTAIAKGIARNAEVVLLRALPFEVDELIAAEPPEAEPEPTPVPPPRPRFAGPSSFPDASRRWVADHRREYPRYASLCPVCGDKGSFGHLPDDDTQWYCFSTDHTGVGISGDKGYHGDALDLEAHDRGCKPVDVLRRDGYLPEARPRQQEVPTPRVAQAAGNTALAPQPVVMRRPLRNRSYLTAVQILENGDRVLKEPLEYNEMIGTATIGRKPIHDTDVTRLRSEIERCFTGGLDKNGNETGLQLSKDDLFSAVEQVARDHSYHPVREYLERLKWDGKQRVDHIAEDILGAERTALNQALIRRFMVSAVARVFEPGCKVDTVLILVGEQGAHKSMFFRDLAGPQWFVDSRLSIESKDAYTALRRAWIYEWGELDALKRARDSESVKAFLSSQVDTYRPAYGRNDVQLQRSCVIVGSTNAQEFLSDPTGNRRFWPLVIGPSVDSRALCEQRDHLWAESVALYRRHLATRDPVTHEGPDQWWLTDEESAEISRIHRKHLISDAWEDIVLEWADACTYRFTTAEVMLQALKIDVSRQGRSEQMRVTDILRRNGWSKVGSSGKNLWVKK